MNRKVKINRITSLSVFAGAILVTALFAKKVAGVDLLPLVPPVVPSITPPIRVTPTPTITPSLRENLLPMIIYPKQKWLPPAEEAQHYRTVIIVLEPNGDPIKVKVHGLPRGLNYLVSQPYNGGRTAILIEGRPQVSGFYPVLVTANDGRDGVARRSFSLRVYPNNLK